MIIISINTGFSSHISTRYRFVFHSRKLSNKCKHWELIWALQCTDDCFTWFKYTQQTLRHNIRHGALFLLTKYLSEANTLLLPSYTRSLSVLSGSSQQWLLLWMVQHHHLVSHWYHCHHLLEDQLVQNWSFHLQNLLDSGNQLLVACKMNKTAVSLKAGAKIIKQNLLNHNNKVFPVSWNMSQTCSRGQIV